MLVRTAIESDEAAICLFDEIATNNEDRRNHIGEWVGGRGGAVYNLDEGDPEQFYVERLSDFT